MAIWKNLFAGLRALFHKRAAECDLDEELRDFLEKSAAEKIHGGMSRPDAYRAARMEIGGIEAVKENVRAESWETVLETIWSDLRFGARLLRFNPVFAGAAILSLALGIGANTAIFQLLDAVRMRTLPVKNPQEIARVTFDHRGSRSGTFSWRYPDFTYPIWQQIRDKQRGFSSVFAWEPVLFNVSPSGEVRYAQGLWVSGEFFETLDVRPTLGRLLSTADDQPGCTTPGAVLSYSYWQQEFGGSRAALKQSVLINRHSVPIIGVAAPNFYGVEVGRNFDVALPLCGESLVNGTDSMLKNQANWWLSVMGRLKPGWSLERAGAQLRAISPGIFQASLPANYNPSSTKDYLSLRLAAIPGGSGLSDLRESYEQPLWLLLSLAALVLLIASANLANLMLARATARKKEMAMRMALGAGRTRLIRQLLAESLLLAASSSVFAAVLSRGLSQALVASLSTQRDPLFVELATDWRVLGFTAGLAVLTCLLFGLAPAFQATSIAPGAVLKESGRGTANGGSRFGLRQALVVSEVALSLMLLAGALLFARSLNNLSRLDPGFQRDGILVADVDFSARHLAPEARRPFAEQLLQRMRALPGVDSAASATVVPLSGDGIGRDILIGPEGESAPDVPTAVFNFVSPGYFQTLQTPFLMGRDFDEHDRQGAPNVAIVNEAFVGKFLPGKNPFDATFRVRSMSNVSATYRIIGVVRDTKYLDLREQAQPIVYTSQAQTAQASNDALILLRSKASLGAVLLGVKDLTSQVAPDADVTFYNLHKMIDDGLLRDQLMARLSGFFGGLAVVLAVLGLYGVISYMVAQRRNEIGIRITLGATRSSIVTLVLRQSLVLLGAGAAIGIVLAVLTSRAATSILFGLKPYDPLTLTVATVSLTLVALAATYIPAIRAARVDPMEALRHE